MKKKLLFTGGSGLLALNWALATRDQYAVTLGMHKRKVALCGVETKPLCLDSVDAIVQSLQKLKPDMLVHTAGMTNVEECEANPDMARYINVSLAVNVARACALVRIPLVHISTDHLFAGDEAYVKETQPVAPQNIYARTKGEAEAQVLEACPQALVVRTNFYGWGPSYRQSFSDVIINTLRQGRLLTLFQDVYFTPILTEILAQVTHELVKQGVSGIFHVVGDERISKYKFGIKIAEKFSLDFRLIKSGFLADHPDLVRRPPDMSLSNQKVCTLLGRNITGMDQQIRRLLDQEETGLAREVRAL